MKEEPTPALLEIGKIKRPKLKNLQDLITLEEGMIAVVEAVDYA